MATKKRIRRQTGSALSVAAAVAMLVAPVLPTMRVAEAGDWMPMLPDQDFYDFQLFAPPDLREYSLYPHHNTGIWFQYDYLIWMFSQPDNQQLASQDSNDLISFNLDSNYLNSDRTNGGRAEFGFTNFDGVGLMASGFVATTENPETRSGGNVARVIRPNPSPANPADGTPGEENFDNDLEDYPFFNLQETSTQAEIYHSLETYGVELNYSLRWHKRDSRTAFTFLIGPRYLNFSDRFGWEQTGVITQEVIPNPAYAIQGQPGGALGGQPGVALPIFAGDNRLFEPFTATVTDFAQISAVNNLVGPQLGGRVENSLGRWKFLGEFRAAPLVNFQNVQLTSNQAFSNISSSIGTGLGNPGDPQDIIDANTRFSAQVAGFNPINSVKHYTVFSMMGEYRADIEWKMSKAISLRAAYTGMIISNITRSPNYLNVDPTTRLFALDTNNRWQRTIFMNGFNFGIELNR